MIIITYSVTTADTLKANLGGAHYSYYFIYAKYLPALEKIGTVIAVREPETEVDRIFLEHPDEEVVFLSFTPPGDTVSGLQCPTVCVFAWEFSTIPGETWNDLEENNWIAALNRLGNATTLSHYARDVAARATDADVNIAVIPAPVATISRSDIPADRSDSRLFVEAENGSNFLGEEGAVDDTAERGTVGFSAAVGLEVDEQVAGADGEVVPCFVVGKADNVGGGARHGRGDERCEDWCACGHGAWFLSFGVVQ